jgi:microcystin-dependent protein
LGGKNRCQTGRGLTKMKTSLFLVAATVAETLGKLRITGMLLFMIVAALMERWRSAAGRKRRPLAPSSAKRKSNLSRRMVAGLTAFALYSASIFSPALETRALASQNSLLSPTTGTVSGLQLTNNYNNALDSVNTANSGASAPTNQLSGSASLGNWWLNTTAAPFPLGMNDGSANWLTLAWLDNSAHAWNVQIGGGAATLASASTVDLCSTARNYLTISGTTTITSFGSTCPVGVVKLVTFSGALTLTYNATSLIIPGAAPVSPTSPGDQATLVSLGSGNWQVASYTPASGAALINPAIDVGSYVLTAAVTPPSSKYLLAFGQAISRTTYATFMTNTTITQSVTRTNGSPTLTGFSDTTQIRAGAPVEGSGIPSSLTISSCTSTTCAMSGNASSSGTANVTIFPNGNGDGSTTFNLPNCQDVVLAGRGNMSGTPRALLTSTYFGASPDALGSLGGGQSQTLVTTNLPPYTPGGSITNGGITINGGGSLRTVAGDFNNNGGGGGSFGAMSSTAPSLSASQAASSFSGTAQGGSSTPFSNVQPTLTANCMVRVLAMIDAPTFPNSIARNDNGLPIVADRRRAIG